MPTMTLASWATIFTGTPPAEHGVVGNEYFDRTERRYVGPGPISVPDPDLVLKVYTEGYANKLLGAPTIYERLRARDPSFSSWVVLSHFYRGADRLILADRAVLGDAFAAMLDMDDDDDDLEMFASLDREVIESLCEQLATESGSPDSDGLPRGRRRLRTRVPARSGRCSSHLLHRGARSDDGQALRRSRAPACARPSLRAGGVRPRPAPGAP